MLAPAEIARQTKWSRAGRCPAARGRVYSWRAGGVSPLLTSTGAHAPRSPGMDMSLTPTHALSLKQPWATLLVHGRKTIEVRRWATRRRGLLLIHAARLPDPRREAWKHVPV